MSTVFTPDHDEGNDADQDRDLDDDPPGERKVTSTTYV